VGYALLLLKENPGVGFRSHGSCPFILILGAGLQSLRRIYIFRVGYRAAV
jgi:hypothetical protein